MVCRYAEEHPRIAEQLRTHDRELGDHESRLRAVEQVVFEARGAWKFALVLATVVGSAVGALVTAGFELLLRGHHP